MEDGENSHLESNKTPKASNKPRFIARWSLMANVFYDCHWMTLVGLLFGSFALYMLYQYHSEVPPIQDEPAVMTVDQLAAHGPQGNQYVELTDCQFLDLPLCLEDREDGSTVTWFVGTSGATDFERTIKESEIKLLVRYPGEITVEIAEEYFNSSTLRGYAIRGGWVSQRGIRKHLRQLSTRIKWQYVNVVYLEEPPDLSELESLMYGFSFIGPVAFLIGFVFFGRNGDPDDFLARWRPQPSVPRRLVVIAIWAAFLIIPVILVDTVPGVSLIFALVYLTGGVIAFFTAGFFAWYVSFKESQLRHRSKVETLILLWFWTGKWANMRWPWFMVIDAGCCIVAGAAILEFIPYD